MATRVIARLLATEFVGTFALVLAGSGAVMVDAPARSIGPAVIGGDLHALWLYILAPLAGAALGALAYQLIRSEPPLQALA